MVRSIKYIFVLILLLICSSCQFAKLTNSVTVKPQEIRDQPDIRIEEVYTTGGDTILIDQALLLATLLDREHILFYDHNGEFLKLRLNDVEGLRVRYKDFNKSVAPTYVRDGFLYAFAAFFTGWLIWFFIAAG